MFQGAPPRLDHGVRELQSCEGQDSAQHAGHDQVIDLGIHVLDARVRQHDRRRLRGLLNIFRFDDQDRLAEEWVRTDNRSVLRQLGAPEK
jgi:hypothetical protein